MIPASPYSAVSAQGPDLAGGQAPFVYPQMTQIFADSDRRRANTETQSARRAP